MTGSPRRFETTRWTVVLAAGRDGTPRSRDALATLCEWYWPPLYAYARRRGYSIDEAQDLTQSFFARFLEKDDVRAADPLRGRFRSFLLTAFQHFLANRYDHAHTQKRGGNYQHIPIEVEAAEASYRTEPSDTLTPELIFERQWARGILDRARATLRDDMAKAGKSATFIALQDALGGEPEDRSYAQIGETLGLSGGAVRVTVHRLRRRFRDVLRAEILATVTDDSEADDEMRHLLKVFDG